MQQTRYSIPAADDHNQQREWEAISTSRIRHHIVTNSSHIKTTHKKSPTYRNLWITKKKDSWKSVGTGLKHTTQSASGTGNNRTRQWHLQNTNNLKTEITYPKRKGNNKIQPNQHATWYIEKASLTQWDAPEDIYASTTIILLLDPEEK